MSEDMRSGSYEELVAFQFKTLQDVLLSKHRLEMDGLRRELTGVSFESDDMDATVPSEENGTDLNCHQRWALLTEKLVQDREWMEDVTGLEPMKPQKSTVHELHMRKPWATSMLKRKGRAMRVSMAAHETTNLKMNDAKTDDSILQRFVVGPQSNIQLFWSMCACILIMWDMITIPLELFDSKELSDIQSVVNLITFTFWVIDMPLNCFFGIHLHGIVELRPSVLCRIYLSTWFGVDALIISIDISRFIAEAAFGDTMSSSLSSGRYLRALRILRLLRLTRIGKLQKKFTLLANRFLSTYIFMVLKVVSTLTLMLAINHIIACCWYGVASLNVGETWLTQIDSNPTIFDYYVASLHWSLTQFTPSTNNIAPANGLERSFAVFVILLAMGFFSSFVGSITSTVNTLRSIQAAKVKQQDKLFQFFVERNMSLDLYSKVQEVIKTEKLSEVRLHETEVEIVNTLPERFRMQLHEEMFMNSLLKLQCWPKDLPNNETSGFLRRVCHDAMSETVVKRGEDLFLPHGECHSMYLVEPGNALKYALHGRGSVVGPGESLCLPSLWAEWHYCGRCTAEFGPGYCTRVDGEIFANLAAKLAGQVSRYLQIFGILLIGAVEAQEEIDDLCFPKDKMDALAARAALFAESSDPKSGKIFRGTLTKESLSPVDN